MSGFLVFQKDKSVKMVNFESLEQIGMDTLLHLFKFREPYLAGNWQDSIRGNYNNIVEIYSALKIEQERNQKNQSKIKALYP
jgi:hypothetical protein